MNPMRTLILALCALLALAVPAEARPPSSSPPPVGHVFVVFLENENADTTFGPGSPAPYLSQTLRSQGASKGNKRSRVFSSGSHGSTLKVASPSGMGRKGLSG